MELILARVYHQEATHGVFYVHGRAFCPAIELPWADNAPKLSCIPEGRYPLRKRYSKKFAWHILVEGVASRNLILIHPANDARKELQGCIAPVSRITGLGRGEMSRRAFEALRFLVYDALDRDETVFLNIQKDEAYERVGKVPGAHP